MSRYASPFSSVPVTVTRTCSRCIIYDKNGAMKEARKSKGPRRLNHTGFKILFFERINPNLLPFFHQEASRCDASKKHNGRNLSCWKTKSIVDGTSSTKHISHGNLLKILFVLDKVSIRRLEEFCHYFFLDSKHTYTIRSGRRILTSLYRKRSLPFQFPCLHERRNFAVAQNIVDDHEQTEEEG